MSDNSATVDQVASIFRSLDIDAQRVLQVVIQVELDHLHLGKPHGIVAELQNGIERVVK